MAHTNRTAILKQYKSKVRLRSFQGMFGDPGVCLKLKSPMNTAGLVVPDTCFEDVRRVTNVPLGHLWAVSHQMFPCAKIAAASPRR